MKTIMAGIFTMVISILFVNCETIIPNVISRETTASSVVPRIWDVNPSNAIHWSNRQSIASASFRIGKIINDTRRYFSYEGYLYDLPIKNDDYDTYLIDKGLTNNDFPRSGSIDSQIMLECINDLKMETGGKNGDYFTIYIYLLTEREYNSNYDGVLIMFIVGRFEPNNNISGRIWRKI
jgi:hypothetical protein